MLTATAATAALFQARQSPPEGRGSQKGRAAMADAHKTSVAGSLATTFSEKLKVTSAKLGGDHKVRLTSDMAERLSP